MLNFGEFGEEKKEKDQDFVDGVSNLINLCLKKREELLDRVIYNDEDGLSATGMSIFCDEMKYSYNALKKIGGKVALNKSLSKRIQEATKTTMGTFRAKIEATVDAVKEMEESEGSIIRLRESNYGLENTDTSKTDYFELDPNFIEEIAKTKPDEKSWGKSQVFDDTKFILLGKGIAKGFRKAIEFFGRPNLTLGEGNDEDVPEILTFDEEVKVHFTDEKQNTTNENMKVNPSIRREESER